MSQYWSLDPESLWINTTLTGVPYIDAEITDQYEDTDHENREFMFDSLETIPGIIEFLTEFMERYGK